MSITELSWERSLAICCCSRACYVSTSTSQKRNCILGCETDTRALNVVGVPDIAASERPPHRAVTSSSGYMMFFSTKGRPLQQQKKAYDKLRRYGFNPERRCLLTTVADKLLVRVTPPVEVFPCSDFRDILHGLCIFLYRMVCVKGFNQIVWSSKTKQLLDLRLSDV